MTKEERETIIRWDESSNTAILYTCKRGLANRVIRRGYKPTQEYRNSGRVVAWEFSIPKPGIHIKKAPGRVAA